MDASKLVDSCRVWHTNEVWKINLLQLKHSWFSAACPKINLSSFSHLKFAQTVWYGLSVKGQTEIWVNMPKSFCLLPQHNTPHHLMACPYGSSSTSLTQPAKLRAERLITAKVFEIVLGKVPDQDHSALSSCRFWHQRPPGWWWHANYLTTPRLMSDGHTRRQVYLVPQLV